MTGLLKTNDNIVYKDEKNNHHWTDTHIIQDKNSKEYVAYDEVGLEHSRHMKYNDARDALIVYNYTELQLG